jgi:flavin reductase (DIM6/NTAB) family NADH-FMN oxidoreductase RutF
MIDITIAVEEARLRDVLSRYISGVTVVTTSREDRPTGVTVSSFTSVTLEPPTVLTCLYAQGRVSAAVQAAGCFAINILSGSQGALARRFAAPGLSDEERYRWLELNSAITGCPLIAGAAAWLDCRLSESFHVGTHKIFVGTVVAAGADATGETPLIYYRRSIRPLA